MFFNNKYIILELGVLIQTNYLFVEELKKS